MELGLHIIVSIKQQTLSLYEDDRLIKNYPIATAKNWVGEKIGSECTPRGKHIIRAKIGQHAKANSVFIARRQTGEFFNEALRKQYPNRDWILTRILWLSGLEPGRNRLGNVDTMRRYIYIHGCPDADIMGVPSSHGCIKMHNSDVIELYDRVEAGCVLNIKEE